MAFFRNDQVNWLNLHYGIHALALTGGGAFLGAFLLRAGVPAPGVLVAWALTLCGRFLVRPAVLPLARRFGLRPLVISGALLVGAEFPILANVHGVGVTLLIFVIFSALAESIYWTCYHAYFASLGDAEHRGHQVGAREAIAAIVGIAGPLAAGWALSRLGPQAAFWATGLVLAASALPLLATPQVLVLDKAPGALTAAWVGVRLFAADGWIGAGTYLVWQIALFVSLDESYAAYGAAMALAALVGAVSGLILGRWIDRGHGVLAVPAAVGATALGVIFRGVAFGSPVLAALANAAVTVAAALYLPTLMTAVYNQAKRSPCPLRFHIATEGGYDAGCAAGLLAAAALLWAKVPMGWVLILPLAGLGVQAVQLGRYYGDEDPLKPMATI